MNDQSHIDELRAWRKLHVDPTLAKHGEEIENLEAHQTGIREMVARIDERLKYIVYLGTAGLAFGLSDRLGIIELLASAFK